MNILQAQVQTSDDWLLISPVCCPPSCGLGTQVSIEVAKTCFIKRKGVIISRVEGCVTVSRVYASRGYMVCPGPTRPLQVIKREVISHFTDM